MESRIYEQKILFQSKIFNYRCTSPILPGSNNGVGSVTPKPAKKEVKDEIILYPVENDESFDQAITALIEPLNTPQETSKTMREIKTGHRSRNLNKVLIFARCICMQWRRSYPLPLFKNEKKKEKIRKI